MTHADFKTLAVLGIQIAMLGLLGRSLWPMMRNPRYRVIVSGLRPRHFGAGLAIIVLVFVVAALLIEHVPAMGIGWFALLGGGSNVAVAAPADNTHAPTFMRALPLVLIGVVAIIAPVAALREERLFRRGTENQSFRRRWTRQMVFGLAHMVMGIPLGAALAIGLGGGGFMRTYRRRHLVRQSRLDAVLESTRTHLAYNLLLLALVGLASAILLLGRPA